jgi:hypothetical protein
MKSDEEILNAAESEDDKVFNAEWADWQAKESIPIDNDDLKVLCKVWFGRGVARGTNFMNDMLDKFMEAEEGSVQ